MQFTVNFEIKHTDNADRDIRWIAELLHTNSQKMQRLEFGQKIILRSRDLTGKNVGDEIGRILRIS
jgi:hypothetical protein